MPRKPSAKPAKGSPRPQQPSTASLAQPAQRGTYADLQAFRSNPAIFRKVLLIDAGDGLRPLDQCLDDWQRADFEALDAAWMRVAVLPVVGSFRQRAYLERPRGHSKSSDLGVMALWALFASPRRISGVAAAADRDQGRLIRDAIARLVQQNPWLERFIDVQSYRVIAKETGSQLEILSADVASSWGLTPNFIIADELSVWSSEEFWGSLFSAAAKKKNCVVVCISNAGFGMGSSWQWKVREAARESEDWYFHSLPAPVASWIDRKQLEEQRQLLPALVYDRVWQNRWTSGQGDALEEDAIAAAFVAKEGVAPLEKAEEGWLYVAGLDIGIRKDASAFVVVGIDVGYEREREEDASNKPQPHKPTLAERLWKQTFTDRTPTENQSDIEVDNSNLLYVEGTGRAKLVRIHLWHPQRSGGGKLDLAMVEAAILRADADFALSMVGYDPWQADYLSSRLSQAGVPVTEIPFTAPNLQAMATATLEAFREYRIDLYEHEQLAADLRGLRIEEKGYGVRLTSPRGPQGHGDCATALSLALLAAKRAGGLGWSRAGRVDGPLVCWP